VLLWPTQAAQQPLMAPRHQLPLLPGQHWQRQQAVQGASRAMSAPPVPPRHWAMQTACWLQSCSC
jgi:hypothetical protein